MLRSLFALFAFSGLALSASAHPGEATPAVNSDSQPSSALTSDIVSTLPTDAEIRDILAQMPDMNALMGDMLKIMKDENMQAQLKSTATAFRQKLKSTPEFTQRDANGLPDINAFLGAKQRSETYTQRYKALRKTPALTERFEKLWAF